MFSQETRFLSACCLSSSVYAQRDRDRIEERIRELRAEIGRLDVLYEAEKEPVLAKEAAWAEIEAREDAVDERMSGAFPFLGNWRPKSE